MDDLDFGDTTVDSSGRYEWFCQECCHTVRRLPPVKRSAKSVKCPKCKSPESLTIVGF